MSYYLLFIIYIYFLYLIYAFSFQEKTGGYGEHSGSFQPHGSVVFE